MLSRLVYPCLSVTVVLLLTGCAGLTVPITRSVPKENAAAEIERYRSYYDNPRDLAIYRIAQWNDALTNLQTANGGSIAGQSAIAGVVTYRAARNLSHPATALLAATGLYGNSLSDAFVQVSRINVYLAGVEGMECALAAYGTLPGPYDTAKFRADVALLTSEGTDLAQEIAQSQARSEQVLNGAMVLAVSRISRKVDGALMGSLVTAASQGATWNAAYSFQAEDAKPTPGQMKLMMPKPADPPATIEARGRLQGLLQRSLAMESDVQARRTRLNECDITAPVARIDRSVQALRVDLLGESDPVSIKAGAQASVRLHGGVPPYTPTVVGANPAKIAVTVADGGFATIAVPTGSAAGEYRIAFTDEAPGSTARILKVTIVP